MPRDNRDIEILRSMTPEQKLAVMQSLIRQAYALKEAGIRAVHPALSEDEVRARVRAAVAGDGGDASVVYGDPRFTRDVDLVGLDADSAFSAASTIASRSRGQT